jgi:GT2 family glycosyltransferase
LTPTVSGVVVNYETKDLTASAVLSMLDEPDLAEVVVVDNCSSDGSVDFLRSRLPADRVRIVANDHNAGFGGGVNLGAGQTTGSLLFVLNSDAALEHGSLAPLVQALESESSAAIAAPRIVGPDGSPQIDAFGDFPSLRTMLLRTNRHPRENLNPDWVSGAAMLVRRSAFEQVGGFDSEFHMYLEDVDLCSRLRSMGWEVVRIPESTITHSPGTSSAKHEREQSYHESLMLLLRKRKVPGFEIRMIGAAQRLWSSARR